MPARYDSAMPLLRYARYIALWRDMLICGVVDAAIKDVVHATLWR